MDDIFSLESHNRYKKQRDDCTAAYILCLTPVMIIELTMYVIYTEMFEGMSKYIFIFPQMNSAQIVWNTVYTTIKQGSLNDFHPLTKHAHFGHFSFTMAAMQARHNTQNGCRTIPGRTIFFLLEMA